MKRTKLDGFLRVASPDANTITPNLLKRMDQAYQGKQFKHSTNSVTKKWTGAPNKKIKSGALPCNSNSKGGSATENVCSFEIEGEKFQSPSKGESVKLTMAQHQALKKYMT